MSGVDYAIKDFAFSEAYKAVGQKPRLLDEYDVQKLAYDLAVEIHEEPIPAPRKHVDVYNQRANPLIGRALQRADASVWINGRNLDVYHKQAGLFDRLFQLADETIRIDHDCLNIFEKKPHVVMGRRLQRPDKTVEIQGSRIKVYDKQPSLLLGRTFQSPVIAYKMHDKGLDVYEKPGWKQRFLDIPDRSIVVKEW